MASSTELYRPNEVTRRGAHCRGLVKANAVGTRAESQIIDVAFMVLEIVYDSASEEQSNAVQNSEPRSRHNDNNMTISIFFVSLFWGGLAEIF